MQESKLKIQTEPYPYIGYGATVTTRPGEVIFAIEADPESDVQLVLYKKGTEEIIGEFPMPHCALGGSVRSAVVKGIRVSQIEYNYRIDDEIVTDPAARVVVGRDTFGSRKRRSEHQVRGAFPTPDKELVDDVRPDLQYEDVVAYYLHVRGFTKNRNSRVRHAGTFLGIVEKIPYLTDLGVNQLILMPSCEFEEITRPEDNLPEYALHKVSGKQGAGAVKGQAAALPGAAEEDNEKAKVNYWGYTKSWYFAPKMSYSATGKPDKEFREMVAKLHRAGIEVIMEFAFPSGMDSAYVLQCLTNWVTQYHVDGFRLLSDEKTVAAAARAPQLTGVKMMSAYYDVSAVPRYCRSRLADMNDGFRDDCRRLLKSDEGIIPSFLQRMKEGVADKGHMNYVTSHDGFTLMDLVSYDYKHNEANGEQGRDGAACEYSWNCGEEGPTKRKAIQMLRIRQMKNALMMLMFAQGTPVLLAGDERGNTQHGNNNPYCIDSEVTWIDWKNTAMAAELTRFTALLIRLRKEYMPLASRNERVQLQSGYPSVSCHGERAWYQHFDYSCRSAGLLYSGRRGKEEEYFYIGYNCHWDPQKLALPTLPAGYGWKMIISSALEKSVIEERAVCLPGRSACVLRAIKEIEKTENDE